MSDGTPVRTGTTGDEENLVVENLKWGHYYLVEVNSAPGYRLSKRELDKTAIYHFEVNADNLDITAVEKIDESGNKIETVNTIPNEQTSFQFQKYGYHRHEVNKKIAVLLSEGTFEIHEVKNGQLTDEVAKEFTINSDTTQIVGLNGGTPETGVIYAIKETEAPNGYQVHEKPVFFRLNGYGELKDEPKLNEGNADYVIDETNGVIKFYDEPENVQVTEVTIRKKGYKKEDNGTVTEDLAGGSFQILNKDGAVVPIYLNKQDAVNGDTSKAVESFKVSATGTTIYGLDSGAGRNVETYRLHEVSAPNGYAVSDDVWFDINGLGAVTDADQAVEQEAHKQNSKLVNGYLVQHDTSNNSNVVEMHDAPSDVVNIEISKEFKDEGAAAGIRPKEITVELYKKYEGDTTAVKVEGASAVTLSDANGWKDTETWKNMPVYDVVQVNGTPTIRKIQYTLTETGEIPNLLYHYETKLNENTVEGKYVLTLTNTPNTEYQGAGTLAIQKINKGGPQSEDFRMKLTLTATKDGKTYDLGQYHGAYTVTEKTVDGKEVKTSKKTADREDGYLVIKGGQTATLQLPTGVSYQVEELLETQESTKKTEYTTTYKLNGEAVETGKLPTHTVTKDKQNDTVVIENAAVIFTKIQNDTPKINGTEGSASPFGGKINVKRNEASDDKDLKVQNGSTIDWETNGLVLSWEPDPNWLFSSMFTVIYRNYSADTQDAAPIVVKDFINEDGSLKQEEDACYDALRKRYSTFSIRKVNTKGADGAADSERIELLLSNNAADKDGTIEGLPYTNSLSVRFVPTIAVENTTANDAGGKVMVEGNKDEQYQASSDGKKRDQDENDRYQQTAVFGQADSGYAVDLDNLTIGGVDALTKETKANGRGMRLTLRASMTERDLYEFSETLDGNLIGGTVEVLAKNAKGEATKVKISIATVDGYMSMPLDIGIAFKPEIPDPPADNGGGAGGSDDSVPVKPGVNPKKKAKAEEALKADQPELTPEQLAALEQEAAGGVGSAAEGSSSEGADNAFRVPKTGDDTPIGGLLVFGVLAELVGAGLLVSRKRKRK